MPQSNRIILTDVDGVLLEWENHFTQWMLKRSHFVRGKRRQTYKLLPNKQSEYAMEKRFGVTLKKTIRPFKTMDYERYFKPEDMAIVKEKFKERFENEFQFYGYEYK